MIDTVQIDCGFVEAHSGRFPLGPTDRERSPSSRRAFCSVLAKAANVITSTGGHFGDDRLPTPPAVSVLIGFSGSPSLYAVCSGMFSAAVSECVPLSQVEDQPVSRGSGYADHHGVAALPFLVGEYGVTVLGFARENRGFAGAAQSFPAGGRRRHTVLA